MAPEVSPPLALHGSPPPLLVRLRCLALRLLWTRQERRRPCHPGGDKREGAGRDLERGAPARGITLGVGLSEGGALWGTQRLRNR